MKSAEYENLDRVEREHWYYHGKRDIVRHWFRKIFPEGEKNRLLDYGAGTGTFARSMQDLALVSVLDSYPESQVMLQKHFASENILDLDDEKRIQAADNSFDCITALDVLEHIEDDRQSVNEFHRILRPGGHAIVTVPADMKLWSYWDEELLHFRRYSKETLVPLFPESGWIIESLSYTNVFAYLPVLFIRKVLQGGKNGQRGAGPSSERLEDKVPAAPLNWLLYTTYVLPAKIPNFPAPFGVSLLLIAKRR